MLTLPGHHAWLASKRSAGVWAEPKKNASVKKFGSTQYRHKHASTCIGTADLEEPWIFYKSAVLFNFAHSKSCCGRFQTYL